MWKVPAIDQGTFTEREAKISVMVAKQVCRDCMVERSGRKSSEW